MKDLHNVVQNDTLFSLFFEHALFQRENTISNSIIGFLHKFKGGATTSLKLILHVDIGYDI